MTCDFLTEKSLDCEIKNECSKESNHLKNSYRLDISKKLVSRGEDLLDKFLWKTILYLFVTTFEDIISGHNCKDKLLKIMKTYYVAKVLRFFSMR